MPQDCFDYFENDSIRKLSSGFSLIYGEFPGSLNVNLERVLGPEDTKFHCFSSKGNKISKKGNLRDFIYKGIEL